MKKSAKIGAEIHFFALLIRLFADCGYAFILSRRVYHIYGGIHRFLIFFIIIFEMDGNFSCFRRHAIF